MKRILLLVLAILLTFSGCTSAGNNNASVSPIPSISELADELFASGAGSDALQLHYLLNYPEKYGIVLPVQSLLSTSAETSETGNSLLVLLEQYDSDDLTDEETILFECMKYQLNLIDKLNSAPLLQQALGPVNGIPAELTLLFTEYRLNNKSDIDNYLSLLDSTYIYFEALLDLEKQCIDAGYGMPRATALQVIEQCRETVENAGYLLTGFEERLSAIPDLSDLEAATYIRLNEYMVAHSVLPAYEMLAQSLTELYGISSTGITEADSISTYSKSAEGRQYYEYLSQYSTSTDMTITELETLLSDCLEEQQETLVLLLQSNADLSAQYAELVYPAGDPDAMADYLYSAIAEDFPVNELVPGVDFDYCIKHLPGALEHVLGPALYILPPVDNCYSNIIYVNASYNLEYFYPTLAHEAFPGHLFQQQFFLKENPHPLRCLLSFTGWEEGWATYAELYSYSLAGFSSSLAAFLSAGYLSTHCIYGLCDIGIHYYGWSPDDTAAFLAPYFYSKEDAYALHEQVLGAPAGYLPYSVGVIMFCRLREKYLEFPGSLNIDFHTEVLELGPMPFYLLEKFLTKNS